MFVAALLDAFPDFRARVMADARPTIAAVGPVARLEAHDSFARRFGSGRALAAE